jgi:hypothetical protein
VGDWVLANSRVRFVVEGARASDGYDPHGCSVIAADRHRPPGQPPESRFGEMVLLLNFRGTGCDRMELVSDGADDGIAAIRATGRDELLPYAASLFSPGTEPPPLHASVFRDYALQPDQDALQLTLTVRNDGADELQLDAPYAAMAMNRGLRHWLPGSGFDDDLGKMNPRAEFYGAVGERVSYSLLNLDSPFSPLINFAKVLFGQYAGVKVAPGQARAWRFLLAVGTGDAGSLQAAHARARGAQSNAARLAGSVVGPAGEPIAGARVHVTDAAGQQVLSMARSKRDGSWSAVLPPGNIAVRAVADDRAAGSAQPLALSSGGLESVELQLGAASRIDVAGGDERGALPVKVVAEPIGNGRANLPAALGEKSASQSVIAFAQDGRASLPVFPGNWKVTVSRGFEYDVSVSTVVAPAGGAAQVPAQLHRVVDTAGWVSADFHVHAQNSIDGDDLLAEKVRAFAAEGVEVPVSTEHEYVGDFGPTVRALGLDAFMHAMAGTELTTTFVGHFNIFPLVPEPARVNRGAFEWYGRLVPDVIAEARRRPAAGGAPVVQLNHPRAIGMAYLDSVGFEPEQFAATAPGNAAHFMTAWDAMEVWNGHPLSEFDGCGAEDPPSCVVRHPTRVDWFAFLDRGIRVTGTGNSDSHTASLRPVGYPRTYVRVASDEPAGVEDAAVVAAVKGQAATISGGPFLMVSAPGTAGVPVGPGGTAVADGSGGTRVVKLRIDVQAPVWMGPLSRVDVWRGDANARQGAVLAVSLDLKQGPYRDSGAAVRRVGTTVNVATPVDTWIVVTVRGAEKKALRPVVEMDVPAFAIANPIWVDADGDGKVAPLRP